LLMFLIQCSCFYLGWFSGSPSFRFGIPWGLLQQVQLIHTTISYHHTSSEVRGFAFHVHRQPITQDGARCWVPEDTIRGPPQASIVGVTNHQWEWSLGFMCHHRAYQPSSFPWGARSHPIQHMSSSLYVNHLNHHNQRQPSIIAIHILSSKSKVSK
jgi:hypothetical protein